MPGLLELVQNFRKADSAAKRRDAAEAVIQHIAPEMYLFLLPRISETVDEVRQTVLVEIAAHLDQCTGKSEKELWAWCYTIARRKLAAHFEKKKRSERFIPVDPLELTRLIDESSGMEPFASEEERREILEAFEILKASNPECFKLLWDHFIAGWEFKEIAAAAGVKYDTVLRRFKRCLPHVRPIFENGG